MDTAVAGHARALVLDSSFPHFFSLNSLAWIGVKGVGSHINNLGKALGWEVIC